MVCATTSSTLLRRTLPPGFPDVTGKPPVADKQLLRHPCENRVFPKPPGQGRK